MSRVTLIGGGTFARTLDKSWLRASERFGSVIGRMYRPDGRLNVPGDLGEPRAEVDADLPALWEDTLPVVVVGFENPTEPCVPACDVVELTGLGHRKKGKRVRALTGQGVRKSGAYLVRGAENPAVLSQLEGCVSVKKRVSARK